jgi:hypothetical protein
MEPIWAAEAARRAPSHRRRSRLILRIRPAATPMNNRMQPRPAACTGSSSSPPAIGRQSRQCRASFPARVRLPLTRRRVKPAMRNARIRHDLSKRYGRGEDAGPNAEGPEAFNRIMMSRLDAQRHACRQRDACAGRERGENNENHTFCNEVGAMIPYESAAFSITCKKNSLLGGTMEFCRRSMNSRGPINRKTTEFMRRAKMENCRHS